MIVAIFKGKNETMNFMAGKTYNFMAGKTYRLKTSIRTYGSKPAFIVEDVEDTNRYCPYNSLESFLENWHVVTTRR